MAPSHRDGLCEVLAHTGSGDVIVVHTLDRLGRTAVDTLNLIHDLSDRGVRVEAWPIPGGSTRPTPMTRWRSWP